MVGTQLMQEDPKKILVVVDEAHRGVPDDGPWTKHIEVFQMMVLTWLR